MISQDVYAIYHRLVSIEAILRYITLFIFDILGLFSRVPPGGQKVQFLD